MKRAILLQTEATDSKNRLLSEFLRQAREETNRILPMRKNYRSVSEFQTAIAPSMKKNVHFNTQVISDIARSTWSKQENCTSVRGVTIKFNVPRNCKTFKTKGFNFVELGLYPGKRVAVPIRKNRNWDRFSGLLGSGWSCKTYGLTPSLEIVAYLSKEDATLPCEASSKRNILGIDINAKDFAYTVLTPEGKILKQGYLGQQMWPRKVHFAERRAMLQSLGALKALKRMKHRQRDYVRTTLGQTVREIILLAKRYDVDTIAIEKLRKFKPKGRMYNKKALTIPFSLFRRILEARCFDNGIELCRVDAYHTSRWCVRCGAVNAGHEKGNYSLYRCKECGILVNSDRKASLAVAAKSLLERNGPSQKNPFLTLSGRRVPVSGLVRMSPMQLDQTAVPAQVQPRGKPTGFSRG